MNKIVQGSVEYLMIELADAAGDIDDLAGTSLQFQSKLPDGTFTPWASAANTGMIAKCLIDATVLTPGKYEAYVKFDANPEHPVLGPVEYFITAP